MIQQTDILSLRIGKRLIGISSDSRIFFQMHIVEPGICCDRFCLAIRRLLLQESLLLQYLLHTVILRGICQDQFPVGITLYHNACYHSFQIGLRSPVQGYHNAEGNGIVPFSVTLLFQFRFRTGHKKIAVCLCQALPHRDPGFPQAVTLQII